MNPRLIVMMLVAGAISLGVVMATRSFLSSAQHSGPAEPVERAAPAVKILVASRDLPVGTLLSAEDTEAREWPDTALHAAYVKTGESPDLYDGSVVRATITAGEPITRSALVKQGERGFLAAVLAPGMRAVTVNLTPVSSVGGFLFPGDRVDVILTHAVEQQDGTNNTLSETILQNVRVLAVDQRTESAEREVAVRRTATLEVTPRMAEKIALLERVGQLSLSLRGLTAQAGSIEQFPVDRTDTYTFDSDVSKFITRPDERPKAENLVRVRRGNTVTDIPLDEGDGQ